MPRIITINAFKLLSTPQVGFDLQSGVGTITASYVVGTITETPVVTTDANGHVTTTYNEQFTPHPSATTQGSAVIELGATDVAGAKLIQLLGTIAAQEGLDLQAGDKALTT